VTIAPFAVDLERAVENDGHGEAAVDWLVGSPMDPSATHVDPLPTIPGFPFLHRGSGVLIVGPTGGGRSSLIQACCYDAAREGVRAAYLGHEVTEPEFNARAAVLAARRGDSVDDELRASLARVRYLNLSSVMTHAWADAEAWVEGVVARYEVVVIDPLSAVASVLDLDFDNSNSEFIRWYDTLVQPLRANGVTVAMIDNVGHASEAKTRAKGVSAKSDRADLTFSCSPLTNPVGLVIRANKIRTVRAAFQRGDEWVFGRDSQRLERRTTSSTRVESKFRPTAIMGRISRQVESEPGIATAAIRRAVTGKSDAVDLGLRLLIDERYIECRDDGPAHRHYPLRSFAEDNDPAACPDRAPSDPPTVPPHAPDVPRACPDPAPSAPQHRALVSPSPLKGEGHGPGEVADSDQTNAEAELASVTAGSTAPPTRLAARVER